MNKYVQYLFELSNQYCEVSYLQYNVLCIY